MERKKAALMLFPVLLVLQGCRCVDEDEFLDKGLLICCAHPEVPFPGQGGGPGSGLVLGTSDFSGAGTVLIKLQIEDLSAISGNQGDITAWSGNGAHPSTAPTSDEPFYETGGDVLLRHTTTHLIRDYEPSPPSNYWVWVRVVHRKSDGTQLPPMDLWYEWTPATAPSPDTPHEFN